MITICKYLKGVNTRREGMLSLRAGGIIIRKRKLDKISEKQCGDNYWVTSRFPKGNENIVTGS